MDRSFKCFMALSAEKTVVSAVAGNAFGGLNNFSVSIVKSIQARKAIMPAFV